MLHIVAILFPIKAMALTKASNIHHLTNIYGFLLGAFMSIIIPNLKLCATAMLKS
jgi:hypothetical protein